MRCLISLVISLLVCGCQRHDPVATRHAAQQFANIRATAQAQIEGANVQRTARAIVKSADAGLDVLGYAIDE